MTLEKSGNSPPIFENQPFNKTVGIPLPLYDPYIYNALKNGMTVKQVHEELVTVGFLHRYNTFTKYVKQKIENVWFDLDGNKKTNITESYVFDSKQSGSANPDLNLPDNDTLISNDAKAKLKDKMAKLDDLVKTDSVLDDLEKSAKLKR